MPDPLVIQADGRLTDVAVAYRNPRFIADEVMPRKTVGRKKGEYVTYAKADRFTVPDLKAGPKSKPNEVDWATGTDDYQCLDYGLDDFVPADEISNADLPISPLNDSAEFIADLLDLGREQRVAAIVFASGSYPSSNRTTKTTTGRWSQSASDPIEDILAARDACFTDPDTLVLGSQTWRYLRQHADILNAVKPLGSVATRKGLASTQEVAELFEVERVLVGVARYNTGKKGQTATYARVWGAHAALLTTRGAGAKAPIFGRQFQFGSKVAGRIEDAQRGLRGGTLVRVGESLDAKIIAADTSFLIIDAGDAT